MLLSIVNNRPQMLDPALRRPGRLDREVEVGVPDQQGRAEPKQCYHENLLDAVLLLEQSLLQQSSTILRVLLRTAPHCLEARHIEQLAGCTHGFVGADLQLLVKESALQALRRWRNSPQGCSLRCTLSCDALCCALPHAHRFIRASKTTPAQSSTNCERPVYTQLIV
eukprot:16383-Heterococcus_DN1.PRE.5